jgi:ABC-type transport system substrate-binding protein
MTRVAVRRNEETTMNRLTWTHRIAHGALAAALVAGGFALNLAPAAAATFRFSNQGDALSMDPHSLNESLQLNFTANIYEPLVGRGKKLELVPALATDWKQTAPTVWRFNLRKGVQFHDGTPFTADDVIFSYNRAKGDGSDVKTYVGSIKEIRKINDHAIDVITNEPFPILPDVISLWMIMSKKWCEENRATQPVDKRKGVKTPRRSERMAPARSGCARASLRCGPRWCATSTTGTSRSRPTSRKRSSRRSAALRPGLRPCCRARST